MMAARKISQSKLAREMNLTSTSIGRYIGQLDENKLPDDVWASMVQALRRLGVADAESIRPVRAPATVRTDLIPLAAVFTTREQLENLMAILDGHRDAQAILRVYLAGRLEHLS
jgi:hypothetical protein